LKKGEANWLESDEGIQINRGGAMKKQIFIFVLLGLTVQSCFGMNHYLTARAELAKAAQSTNRYDITNCCNQSDRDLFLEGYFGKPTPNEKSLSCLEICWKRTKRNYEEQKKICCTFWASVRIGLAKVFS